MTEGVEVEVEGEQEQEQGQPVHEQLVYETQAQVLTDRHRFKVFPGGRRVGKSEVGVMWVATKAQKLRREGRKGFIWIVYPTYGIAQVAWNKFFVGGKGGRIVPQSWITASVGTPLQPRSISFGGVTVLFKSGVDPGSLVGEGLLGLWVDECGTIKERVWSESLRPTLIDHEADALLTGSPKGRNWFWRIFSRGVEENDEGAIRSYRTSAFQGIPTSTNPFIKASEVAEMSRDMGQRLYEQEILATFLQNEGAVFRNVRELVGDLCTIHPTAALGVDLAKQQDFTVLAGLCQERHMTYFDRFNSIDYSIQKQRIKQAWVQLKKPVLVLDATKGSVGDPIADDLRSEGIDLDAFNFTGRSKGPLVEGLVIQFDQRQIRLIDEPVLLNELEVFDMKTSSAGNMKYSAPDGEHDDCVIALALANRGVASGGGSLVF